MDFGDVIRAGGRMQTKETKPPRVDFGDVIRAGGRRRCAADSAVSPLPVACYKLRQLPPPSAIGLHAMRVLHADPVQFTRLVPVVVVPKTILCMP